jgi:flavin reductase (DIM6/NTAB) family NADH-FMN oxidoreductase RutF
MRTLVLLLESLQFLARFESDSLAGRNGNLRPGAGVPANAGLARLHVKDAEAAQFNAVSVLESLLHVFEDCFDGHLGLRLGDAGFIDHFVDDIEFDQARLRVRQLDDRVEVTVMSSNLAQPFISAVDPDEFRTGCAKFATGVSILTVIGADGEPRGMTANSFTSVSLDPPLILVCIDLKAAILPRLEASEYFGINVLNENQQDLSSQFARPGTNRFEAVEWFAGEYGVPLLPDVLATFECAVQQTIDAGDHRIFLGQVCRINTREGRPLLYFGSKYQILA